MKLNTRTTRTYEMIESDEEYPITYPADEYMDPFVRDEGDLRLVTYAVHDEFCDNSPLDDNEGVEFEEFRTEWDRDEWAQEQLDAGLHVFVVDHFEHSCHIYRVLGRWEDEKGNRGIDRWDSRPSCILALSRDFTDPEGAAHAIMREYTAWCGGEVYGIVTESFRREGDEWVQVEELDACWGFIGSEYAQQVVNEGGY
jgi:hypothetical protein